MSTKQVRVREQNTQDTDVLNEVADIVGLTKEQVKKINISDRVESLVLIHYKDDADLSDRTIASMRGLIVDIKYRYIVCPGIEFIPSSVVNHDLPLRESTFETVDFYGVKHTIDVTKAYLTPFYRGVNLRVFLHNGKVYLSSLKRLDVASARSRWASHHPTFYEIYVNAGGPSLEGLYPDGQQHSPYVYFFRVYHPLLEITSFIKTEPNGFVRFDGPWTVSPSSYPHEPPSVPQVIPASDPLSISKGVVKTGVYHQQAISFNDAVEFLHHGYLAQPQQAQYDVYSGGESIICSYESDGESRIIQLQSKAFHYRESLFQDEPNQYHAFVARLSIIPMGNMATQGVDEYLLERVPPVQVPDKAYITSNFSKGTLLTEATFMPRDKIKEMSRDELREMVWYDFLINSSQYYRTQAIHFLERFNRDVEDLISWMQSLIHIERLELKDERSQRRVIEILRLTRDNARKMQQRGLDVYYIDKKAKGSQVVKLDPKSVQVKRSTTQPKKQAFNMEVKYYTLDELHKMSIKEYMMAQDTISVLYPLVRAMRYETGTSSICVSEPSSSTSKSQHSPPSTPLSTKTKSQQASIPLPKTRSKRTAPKK